MSPRAKAPTVAPTGCPMCKKLGIPGTSCAVCVEAAHGAAVRAAEVAARAVHDGRAQPSALLSNMVAARAQDARAAWVGACLLLDELGVLLVKVGFEVPGEERRS